MKDHELFRLIDHTWCLKKWIAKEEKIPQNIWSINVPSHHVFRIIIHKGITNNRLYITSGRFIITGIQGYMGKKENVSAKTHQGFSKPNDKTTYSPYTTLKRQFFMHKWLFFLFFFVLYQSYYFWTRSAAYKSLTKWYRKGT